MDVRQDRPQRHLHAAQRVRSDAAQQFAVNVDTRESDLAKADAESLPAGTASPRHMAEQPTRAARRRPVAALCLEPPFLWTALALLFVESFLAWQFGRGTL